MLRFGPALLHLSHAWPFSARNAIRLHLSGPNTHSPRPFSKLFREGVFFTAPEPFFKRPSLASPNFPQNTIHSRLCGPNTLTPVPFWHACQAFFIKMHWFAALLPCFTVPKPCLAVFCKKRDPFAPERSKHMFASFIFPVFCMEMCFFIVPEPLF